MDNSLRSPDLNQLKSSTTTLLARGSLAVSSSSTQVNSNSSTGTLPKFDSNFQNKFAQHLISLSECNFLFVKLTLDLIEKGNLVIKSANFKVLPKSFDDLVKLYFNLKFQSRVSYERLALAVFSVIMACSFSRPLSIEDIYETLNCAFLNNEKVTINELIDQISNLDGFVNPFW